MEPPLLEKRRGFFYVSHVLDPTQKSFPYEGKSLFPTGLGMDLTESKAER